MFDEVHYVPAARQMLLPVMPEPMLNPMHPPLAKQIIAFSIDVFGDNPLGWRYPSALFGAFAIVAVYLCGLALFAAQGPAIAAALIAFFNQMLFVAARIAMLDIFALDLRPVRHRRLSLRLPQGAAALLPLRCRVSPLGLRRPANGAACFRSRSASSSSAVIRLMQGWHTQFADAKANRLVPAGPLARISRVSIRDLFRAGAGARLFRKPSCCCTASRLHDLLEAQRRIFSDNTTTAIAGHTYMSSWPSWPLLMRPVWFLFDKIGDDRISAVVLARQSAGAVAGAARARALPAATGS